MLFTPIYCKPVGGRGRGTTGRCGAFDLSIFTNETVSVITSMVKYGNNIPPPPSLHPCCHIDRHMIKLSRY